MRILFLLLVFASFVSLGFDRHKPAYVLYNEKGREVSYRNMMRKVQEADILLFGELHDNPISHWLQFEVTRDLFRKLNGNLILAAEMFEADNQLILDEYVSGIISESRFEDEARLWRNYKTDYKPLVVFARDNGLPFVASNIPRRYANMVFTGALKHLESLTVRLLDTLRHCRLPTIPNFPDIKQCLKWGVAQWGMQVKICLKLRL